MPIFMFIKFLEFFSALKKRFLDGWVFKTITESKFPQR